MIEEQISLCIKKDRKAQRKVYEHFYGKMLGVCFRYCQNEDDAKDVLNQGFLKVFTRIKDFKFTGSFEGWVRRIMVNTALDHIRANRNHQYQFSIEDNLLSVEDVTYDEDSDALLRLELEEVYALIKSLPPMSQTIFNMFAIDGYSHKEIGEKMNISTGTSKWHVSFARKSLKQALKKTAVATTMMINES